MSEQDYPVYSRLSQQKLSQISGTLNANYDPTDVYDNLPDEPRFCPRCQQHSVFWGSFDEVWYCQNCDDF